MAAPRERRLAPRPAPAAASAWQPCGVASQPPSRRRGALPRLPALRRWYARGKRVALELVQALNALHSRSIIHMDVKVGGRRPARSAAAVGVPALLALHSPGAGLGCHQPCACVWHPAGKHPHPTPLPLLVGLPYQPLPVQSSNVLLTSTGTAKLAGAQRGGAGCGGMQSSARGACSPAPAWVLSLGRTLTPAPAPALPPRADVGLARLQRGTFLSELPVVVGTFAWMVSGGGAHGGQAWRGGTHAMLACLRADTAPPPAGT